MSAPVKAPRRQINLYQSGFRPARIILPTRLLLAGCVLFCFMLTLLFITGSWQLTLARSEAETLTARADQIERQLQQASQPHRQADPTVIAEAEKLENRTAAMQRAQEAVAAGALGSETGYSTQFRALSRATVSGAWLTGVDLTQQGHEMNLSGRVSSGEDPARLIAALREQPLFTGLSYAFLKVQPPEKDPDAADAPGKKSRYLEFSLSAHLPENDDVAQTATPSVGLTQKARP